MYAIFRRIENGCPLLLYSQCFRHMKNEQGTFPVHYTRVVYFFIISAAEFVFDARSMRAGERILLRKNIDRKKERKKGASAVRLISLNEGNTSYRTIVE